MWAIKWKKTGDFLKDVHRNDGLGVPDIHLTPNADDAKIFRSRREANDLVEHLKAKGCLIRFDIVRAWGRTPN